MHLMKKKTTLKRKKRQPGVANCESDTRPSKVRRTKFAVKGGHANAPDVLGCHGRSLMWKESFVLFKVVEARKRVRNENCHHYAIKRKKKPKLLQQTPFTTFFMEIATNSEFRGTFFA